MTAVRTSFPTLEISGTEVGAPLHRVLEDDAYAAKNASAALVAKDVTGLLLKYLQVDANGALLVTMDSIADCLRARGELAAGSGSLAVVTGAVIPLTVDKVYREVGFIVSCLRDALFQIIWNNNGAETILGEILVGAGSYTVANQLHCLSFTAGSTGTQELKIKAMNFNALSSLRASLTVEQVV
jgi:hypothetical protein